MKSVRRSPDCWFKLFEQHEKSGLSMKAFCHPLGINPKYFSLRRKKLGYKNKQSTLKDSDFIQVLPASTSGSEVMLSYSCGLRIEFNTLPPLDYLLSLSGSFK